MSDQTGEPGKRLRPAEWALWRQPRAAIRYYLAIEAITAGITGWLALTVPVYPENWAAFGVLAGMSVAQGELSRKTEQTRRLITNAPHVNMTSVWVFAGVLVLPPSLTGLLVMVVYGHLWVRVWRHLDTRPAHRVVFSTAIIMLSAYAAAGTVAIGGMLQHTGGWVGSPGELVVAAAAGLVFLVVNQILVTVVASLYGRSANLMISWADYALEIATLCLGALSALALSSSLPLIVVILPPLLVLHRAVLVRQLEELATTDQKTGLLNATAWHEAATKELSRAGRTRGGFGVLMLDLDHFKRINDEYGHLAGDDVLKAIARLLEDGIRDYDRAGRFGGEEFAVLVPDSVTADIVATAERLRKQVTELEVKASTDSGNITIRGLSVSIGVAVYPRGGTTLEQLMLSADTALYTAKANGRNQVVSLE